MSVLRKNKQRAKIRQLKDGRFRIRYFGPHAPRRKKRVFISYRTASKYARHWNFQGTLNPEEIAPLVPC